MFTGIIKRTGEVLWLRRSETSTHLVINIADPWRDIHRGDSVAVNGACLTLTAHRGTQLTFDLLQQTLDVTNIRTLRPQSVVNLERPLRAGSTLDGHFVQGHIDCTAEVLGLDKVEADYRLEVALPEPIARYVISKGSIALNGVSLTVAELASTSFVCWIIPETRSATNLSLLKPGDLVNIECDMLGKYVERLLSARFDASPPPS